MERIQLRDKTFKQITYYKTGTGPSILLVHGFPANVHLWRNIVPELAKHFTIILPAFFEEEGDWLVDDTNNMSLLAEGFNDILDNEDIEQVLLAGHSMGGYMGLAFAEKYAHKLAGLSLIHSSALADDEARAEGRRKTIQILEKGGKNPFLKKMVKALFPEDFNQQKPEICSRQTEEALMVHEKSLIAFYRAIMHRKDSMHITKGAKFPVQNIIGLKDSLANPQKEIEGENLSCVNFVSTYPNEGHMAMLENPALLLKDLLHFSNYCYRL